MPGWRARRLLPWAVALPLALALVVGPPERATAAECAKVDFEAIVDDAGAALRELNQKNKPSFQEKLRALKDKRGWSHDQFLKEAAPYVRDEQIEGFDKTSDGLLGTISTMGQEGADAANPNCALLKDLRTRLSALVETQTKKWQYMFTKLDAELGK